MAGRAIAGGDPSTQTRGDAFLAFQRPLHEGDALGLPGRVLVSVVGLFPALFVTTGAMIWLRSRRRRAVHLARAGETAESRK